MGEYDPPTWKELLELSDKMTRLAIDLNEALKAGKPEEMDPLNRELTLIHKSGSFKRAYNSFTRKFTNFIWFGDYERNI